MPEVMLPHSWPNRFRRTVTPKSGKPKVLEFVPGVPVDLRPSDVELLKHDIGQGRPLQPVFRDARGKARVLVEPVDTQDKEPASVVTPVG